MEIKVQAGDILQAESDLAVLGAFENEPLPAAVAALLEPQDFRARAEQTLLLYPRGSSGAATPAARRAWAPRAKATAETIRRVSATAAKEAQRLQVPEVTVAVHGELPLAPELAGQAFAEGLALGGYRYWHYRTGLTDEQTFVVERAVVFARAGAEVRAGVQLGLVTAGGVAFARDLVNGPGYAMTPAKLADEAVRLGERFGLKVTVLDKAQLTERRLRRHPGRGQRLGERSALHCDGVRRSRRGRPDHLPGRQGADLRLRRSFAQAGRRDGDHEVGHGRRGGRIRRDAGGQRVEAASACRRPGVGGREHAEQRLVPPGRHRPHVERQDDRGAQHRRRGPDYLVRRALLQPAVSARCHRRAVHADRRDDHCARLTRHRHDGHGPVLARSADARGRGHAASACGRSRCGTSTTR